MVYLFFFSLIHTSSGSQEEEDDEYEDLYTAGDTAVPEDGMMLDEASAGPSSLKVSQGATGLQEQEPMSLAIQNSVLHGGR